MNIQYPTRNSRIALARRAVPKAGSEPEGCNGNSKAIAASRQPLSSGSDQNSSSMQREALLTNAVMYIAQPIKKGIKLSLITHSKFGYDSTALGALLLDIDSVADIRRHIQINTIVYRGFTILELSATCRAK